MALVIAAVLGEHAPQVNLAGLGRAVGLLAAPPLECFGYHRHASAVRAHIEERGIAGAGLGLPLLPSLGVTADPLDDALNLPRRNGNAAGLLQMPLGFQVGRLIGTLQTDQLGRSE